MGEWVRGERADGGEPGGGEAMSCGESRPTILSDESESVSEW